ncbi:MAG: DinB family protein [Anaerobacillus sp.]
MKQRHEVLFQQLENFRGYLLNAANVSENEAEIIPKGFNNNIRWNLGHVYTEQYMWIETLINEEVAIPPEFNEWFGWGTSPEDFTSETPSLEQMRTLLSGQLSEIKEKYGERLEKEFPPTELWEMSTIEQVLLWTNFHEGMHLQKITDIKNVMKP